MNTRYLALASAYAQRDQYLLILFGFAAGILLTDWSTRQIRWLSTAFRIFLIAAFVGEMIFAWINPHEQ